MKRKAIPAISETAERDPIAQRAIVARKADLTKEPVSAVEWVPRNLLKPNDYNPNSVAPTELELLIESILEDGWTQPIVRREGNFIVDGFHRWFVSADPRLMQIYDGFVPTVMLRRRDFPQLSTIRHNRARGVHAILPMAEIVATLVRQGLSEEDFIQRLGMESEEISRLLDRSGSPQIQGSGFGKAWKPGEERIVSKKTNIVRN